MFTSIINNSLYGETLLIFIVIAWFFMRYVQRKTQKNHGLNNFEFWVYYNLVDFYKFNGYPYPEMRAKEEIIGIMEKRDKECNLKNNSI
jgi:hypothetical protein